MPRDHDRLCMERGIIKGLKDEKVSTAIIPIVSQRAQPSCRLAQKIEVPEVACAQANSVGINRLQVMKNSAPLGLAIQAGCHELKLVWRDVIIVIKKAPVSYTHLTL